MSTTLTLAKLNVYIEKATQILPPYCTIILPKGGKVMKKLWKSKGRRYLFARDWDKEIVHEPVSVKTKEVTF